MFAFWVRCFQVYFAGEVESFSFGYFDLLRVCAGRLAGTEIARFLHQRVAVVHRHEPGLSWFAREQEQLK
jgi:hypothetical protein